MMSVQSNQGRGAEVALPVALVPLGMLLHERVVPRGVVGDPVEDDVQPEPVRGGDEVLEVGERAELGVDAEVVAHGVGTAEDALAVLGADRVDRHEPDDVGAERLDPRQLYLRRGERPLGGELPEVDLVERGAPRPFRVVELDVGDRLVPVGIAMAVASRAARGAATSRARARMAARERMSGISGLGRSCRSFTRDDRYHERGGEEETDAAGMTAWTRLPWR